MTADRRSAGAGQPRRAWRRRWIVLGGAVVVLLLLVIGAGLAAFRYLPAVDEARLLRTDLEAMVDRVQEAGLEIDGETLDSSRHSSSRRGLALDRLRDLVASDPLIGVAARLAARVRRTSAPRTRMLAAGDEPPRRRRRGPRRSVAGTLPSAMRRRRIQAWLGRWLSSWN